MDTEEIYEHELYMKRCIVLANIAKQRGDSPVGSIIVHNGHIIAEGIEGGKTHKDITYHAEIEAIRQATESLHTKDFSGCVIYTTHEPCIMCSYVIRHIGLAEIVFGVATGEIGGYSSVLPLLLDTSIKRWGHPPKIVSGILEEECRLL